MHKDTNPNRLNIYICPRCHRHIVTKDIDKGTTPFLIRCEATPNCTGRMQSSLYRVFDPDAIMAHSHEWYKPPLLLATMSPMTVEHISKGGLLLRPVTNDNSRHWRPTHRHVKTGGVYRMIDEAKMQSSSWCVVGTESPVDMRPVIVYEAQDGKMWVRPKKEFEDGRFEQI